MFPENFKHYEYNNCTRNFSSILVHLNKRWPVTVNRLLNDTILLFTYNYLFICFLFQKTPFASTNEKSELGKFYREWQTAPPLQTFVDEMSPLDELDVTKQLETFESDLNEFDNVVQSLCQSAIN